MTRGRRGKKASDGPGGPAPGPMATTRDVAARLGCTEQNVRYLCTRGMPHQRGKGGRIGFDLDAAEAWYHRFRKSGGQGGDRRPAASHPPDRVVGAAVRGPGKPDEPAEDAEDLDGPLSFAELRLKTRDELDRLKLAEQVLTLRVEREQAEGVLVKAEEARNAWMRATNAAGRRLRGLARTVAGELCAQLGIDASAENTAVVRRVIDRHVEDLCAALRMGGMAGEKHEISDE